MESQCPQCHSRLRIPDDAAAKKIRCPSCQAIITLSESGPEVAIPSPGSTPEVAPQPRPEPIAPAGETQRPVKLDDGQPYGPISKADLDRWVAEGRLGPECQLLKSGSGQWEWAGDVFPQLAAPPSREPPTRSSASSGFPNVAQQKPSGAPYISTDNPYASPSSGSNFSASRARRIPDVLPWAIFALICCGGIFAVPAIVYAAQANSMKSQGDYAGAARAASSAQTWLYIAIGIGIAANILGGLVVVATS